MAAIRTCAPGRTSIGLACTPASCVQPLQRGMRCVARHASRTTPCPACHGSNKCGCLAACSAMTQVAVSKQPTCIHQCTAGRTNCEFTFNGRPASCTVFFTKRRTHTAVCEVPSPLGWAQLHHTRLCGAMHVCQVMHHPVGGTPCLARPCAAPLSRAHLTPALVPPTCRSPQPCRADLRRRLEGPVRGHHGLRPGRLVHRAVRPRRRRHLHQGR